MLGRIFSPWDSYSRCAVIGPGRAKTNTWFVKAFSFIQVSLAWFSWVGGIVVAAIGLGGTLYRVALCFYFHAIPGWGRFLLMREGLAFSWLGLTLASLSIGERRGAVLGVVIWVLLAVGCCEGVDSIYYGGPEINLVTAYWLLGMVAKLLVARLVLYLAAFVVRRGRGFFSLLAISPLIREMLPGARKIVRGEKKLQEWVKRLKDWGEWIADIRDFLNRPRYRCPFGPWYARPSCRITPLPSQADMPVPQVPDLTNLPSGPGLRWLVVVVLVRAVCWAAGMAAWGPVDW